MVNIIVDYHTLMTEFIQVRGKMENNTNEIMKFLVQCRPGARIYPEGLNFNLPYKSMYYYIDFIITL